MGEIVFVRHGQANSAATTEEDYDRLSELGHEQAKWLGHWMSQHEKPFDVAMSGSLLRQRQTLAGMGFADTEVDPRLNEIAYYDLSDEMKSVFGLEKVSPDEFVTHFPKTLEAWKSGEIKGQETWQEFQDRVTAVLALAQQPGKRVLCVSSGGVIATVVAQLLDLPIPQMARIALPILNTSVHRVLVTDHGPMLATFNSAPHLDVADRDYARTVY